MNVEHDLVLLVQEIRRLGSKEGEKFGVKFGTLFLDDRCQQIFEALVGTLRAAKKRRIVDFEGQMLLAGAHDDVFIELLAPGADDAAELATVPASGA